MRDFSVLIPWREDESKTPTLGDGLSRPKPGDRTKEFTVLVHIKGSKPMKWITRAPSGKTALTYAKNRWPHADVSLSPKN